MLRWPVSTRRSLPVGTLLSPAPSICQEREAAAPCAVIDLYRKLMWRQGDGSISAMPSVLPKPGMENITSSFAANTTVFNRLVTEGPAKLQGLSAVTMAILNVVGASRDVGNLGGQLINPIAGDLIQILSYITPMVGTMATADTTIPVVADKIVALLRYKLLGFFRNGGPKYTITELHPPTGHEGVDPADKADQAVQAMQTMGMLP